MNANEKASWFELARGIINFILAVVLMLATASGLFHFMPVAVLGLVVVNVDLLKLLLDPPDDKHIIHPAAREPN